VKRNWKKKVEEKNRSIEKNNVKVILKYKFYKSRGESDGEERNKERGK